MDFTWLFITGGSVITLTLLVMLIGLFSSRASLKQANIWRKRLDHEIKLRVEAVHQQDQLKATLAQQQREFEKVNQDFKKLQKQAETSELSMREAQQKINVFTVNERVLRAQLSNATAQSSETARKTISQQNNITALGEQIERLNAELIQTQKELLNQQQLVSQMQQRLKDQSTEREQFKKQISLHVESIQRLQTDLSGTRKQLGNVQRENARLESWLASSFNMDVHANNGSDMIESAQNTLRAYRQKTDYQQQQIESLTDLLHDRNTDLEQAQRESLERLSAINSLAENLHNAELALQEMDIVKESFSKMTSRSHQDFTQANAKLQDQQLSSQQVLAEKEAINKQLAIKDRLIEDRDQGIAELRRELQLARTRHDSLRAEFLAIKNASGQVADSVRVLSDDDKNMTSLERIARDLLSTQEEIDRTQLLMDESQQGMINVLKNDVKKFSEKVDASRSEAAENAEIIRLRREVEDMRNQKRRIEETSEQIQQRYMQARNKASELTEQVRELRQQLIDRDQILKDSQSRTVQARTQLEEARQIIYRGQPIQTRATSGWESLTQIRGLSPEYAEQLRRHDILNVQDLANADPTRVKQMLEKTGGVAKLFKGPPDVEDWIRHAKLLIDEDIQRIKEVPSILRGPQPPLINPDSTTGAASDVVPGI